MNVPPNQQALGGVVGQSNVAPDDQQLMYLDTSNRGFSSSMMNRGLMSGMPNMMQSMMMQQQQQQNMMMQQQHQHQQNMLKKPQQAPQQQEVQPKRKPWKKPEDMPKRPLR